MKRLPIYLLLGIVVFGSLSIGCRDEEDPEYWLDYMYDRPWREKSLKTLNEIFSRRALFSKQDAYEIRKLCEKIDRKLNGLINSLRGVKRNKSSKD